MPVLWKVLIQILHRMEMFIEQKHKDLADWRYILIGFSGCAYIFRPRKFLWASVARYRHYASLVALPTRTLVQSWATHTASPEDVPLRGPVATAHEHRAFLISIS